MATPDTTLRPRGAAPTTPPAKTQADGDARSISEPVGAPAGASDQGDRQARIEREAYLRYLDRGGAPGNELDDWLEAERRVDARAE